MNVELRLLKSFQALADHLNFHRAAEELHLTQPALSRQIQQLEETIGKPLFRRDKRSVTLTHAGRFLRGRVSGLLTDVTVLVRETREAADGQRGTLALGYTESAMASFLPSLLRSLREKLPHVSVQLKQGHSEQLSREVTLRRLDAAIVSGAGGTPIATEAMGVVLPDNHPLTVRKAISLSALADEKFILFPYQVNPSLHRNIISGCEQAGFFPNIIEEAESRILAVNMVAAGFGVTFLNENLAHYCGQGTAFRPLKVPKLFMQYCLVEPADGEHPCLDVLKKILTGLASKPNKA
ncbi:MAG: LysR family transcriptional regulator [Verrucomicrobiales bacterium]|jgi:DNA-binding transcriptional LysR family regulator|nr:LysR family transcriptional regulator [Verrucomicrobiales bacterium]